MPAICRFDLPASDFEKLKRFYGQLFGWKFTQDESSTENWSIVLPEPDSCGEITGALVNRSAPDQPIGCYFSVPSVETASARIPELGGSVFVPKTAVAGQGYYACCLDPENNYFLLWEADREAE